jgi:hypothetical protein
MKKLFFVFYFVLIFFLSSFVIATTYPCPGGDFPHCGVSILTGTQCKPSCGNWLRFRGYDDDVNAGCCSNYVRNVRGAYGVSWDCRYCYENTDLIPGCIPMDIPSGSACDGGGCIDECSSGDKGCSGDHTKRWDCAFDGHTRCNYKRYIDCPSGTICSDSTGLCDSCSNECECYQKGCEDETHEWTCQIQPDGCYDTITEPCESDEICITYKSDFWFYRCIKCDTCESKGYECGTPYLCYEYVFCGPNKMECTKSFGTCDIVGEQTCLGVLGGYKYGECDAIDPRIANCAGKECGSDGCGGLCGLDTKVCTKMFGTCNVGGYKPCVGNSYGECPAIDPRIANCEGNPCGSDGCGGTCPCPVPEICGSGSDEDGDGDKDWDSQLWALGIVSEYGDHGWHGDDNCSIGLIDHPDVSNDEPYESSFIEVNCTSNIGNVNSINAYISNTEKVNILTASGCEWISWNGNAASFNCDVGLRGQKYAVCIVNTSRSYQIGLNQSLSIDVQFCGNGIINSPKETCEPPNSDVCDANCQLMVPLRSMKFDFQPPNGPNPAEDGILEFGWTEVNRRSYFDPPDFGWNPIFYIEEKVSGQGLSPAYLSNLFNDYHKITDNSNFKIKLNSESLLQYKIWVYTGSYIETSGPFTFILEEGRPNQVISDTIEVGVDDIAIIQEKINISDGFLDISFKPTGDIALAGLIIEGFCGNGVTDDGNEECDDGDVTDRKGSTESGACIIDDSIGGSMCQDAFCGDGYLSSKGLDNLIGGGDDEVCDDGENNGEIGYCNTDCTALTTYCGDGTQQEPNDFGFSEQCDDGENNGVECATTYGGDNCTYCNSTCINETVQAPSCGDSIIQSGDGEECDDGENNGVECATTYGGDNCTYCNSTCINETVQAPSCGDSIIQPEEGEECDGGSNCNNCICDPGYIPDGANGCEIISRSCNISTEEQDCSSDECCYKPYRYIDGTCISSLPLGINANDPKVEENSCLCRVSRAPIQSINSTCKNTGDYPCWDTQSYEHLSGRCCGNNPDENWTTLFSTHEFLENILVKGYCETGAWKSRVSASTLTYYNIWTNE